MGLLPIYIIIDTQELFKNFFKKRYLSKQKGTIVVDVPYLHKKNYGVLASRETSLSNDPKILFFVELVP